MHDVIHKLCAHAVTLLTRKRISEIGETVFDKYASLRLFNGRLVRHVPHSGNKSWSRCLEIWTDWLLDFGKYFVQARFYNYEYSFEGNF